MTFCVMMSWKSRLNKIRHKAQIQNARFDKHRRCDVNFSEYMQRMRF